MIAGSQTAFMPTQMTQCRINDRRTQVGVTIRSYFTLIYFLTQV